jgi:hypothetical protein
MLSGLVLLLYRETGQSRYRIAAQTIRDRLTTLSSDLRRGLPAHCWPDRAAVGWTACSCPCHSLPSAAVTLATAPTPETRRHVSSSSTAATCSDPPARCGTPSASSAAHPGPTRWPACRPRAGVGRSAGSAWPPSRSSTSSTRRSRSATSLRTTRPTPIAATRACSTGSRSGWTA